jgi:hypothetical protein
MAYRTDVNNNPAAFTTDIAHQAGLVQNTDYVQGEPFQVSIPGTVYEMQTLYTAKLLGDPVALTIRVIDTIGYYTRSGGTRWTYISIPTFIWTTLTADQKRDIVGFHYQHEGGTAMRNLFPNYGKS